MLGSDEAVTDGRLEAVAEEPAASVVVTTTARSVPLVPVGATPVTTAIAAVVPATSTMLVAPMTAKIVDRFMVTPLLSMGSLPTAHARCRR
ncbi:unannotated protein [freshwater metagenome]|uniref:Unannotated protein n=1 Tax=freshwater metagenome TaxID=449393 RepID=A0A6J7L7M4_9ZZZZ